MFYIYCSLLHVQGRELAIRAEGVRLVVARFVADHFAISNGKIITKQANRNKYANVCKSVSVNYSLIGRFSLLVIRSDAHELFVMWECNHVNFHSITTCSSLALLTSTLVGLLWEAGSNSILTDVTIDASETPVNYDRGWKHRRTDCKHGARIKSRPFRVRGTWTETSTYIYPLILTATKVCSL